MITVTLVAFEALAVSAIMPVVVDDLTGLELYGWAFSAFFLGNLVGIVYAGLQIDRHGLARPFALGLGLFAGGLLVGGLAPAMSVLVLGRTIQGFGAAAVPTVAYVAIGRSYGETVRPRMFATMSTAWVVPGLVGPALAGLVADHVGWRFVFLGLVPFVLVGAALVLPSLRPLGPIADDEQARADRRRLVDSLRIALGAALLLATSSIGPGPLSLVAVAAGLAVGLPPLRRLLPPGTLTARRGLPATILSRGAATFAFIGAEAYLPLALVSVRGTSVTAAGVTLTAATLSWTLGSWIQAHRMASWGGPRLIRRGFVCIAIGIAGMATVVVPATPLAATVVAWGIGGLGMGLAYAPISMLVLRDAPPAEQGRATSSLQLSDVLGSALGTGLGGAVVAFGEISGRDPAVAIGAAFLVTLAVAVLGIVLGGRLDPPDRANTHEGRPTGATVRS